MTTKALAIINQGPKRYEFSTSFDGVRYFLTFQYNYRNDTWYLDINDSERNPILIGLAVLTNTHLMTSRFGIDDFLLLGEILIADINDGGLDPSYENFGDEVSAFYTSIIS